MLGDTARLYVPYTTPSYFLAPKTDSTKSFTAPSSHSSTDSELAELGDVDMVTQRMLLCKFSLS